LAATAGSSAARLANARNHRADLNRVAFLEQLLAQGSGNRRRHFDRHLVGLQAGDRLIGRNRFARLLEPLRQRPFGDRFAQRWDLHIGGHG